MVASPQQVKKLESSVLRFFNYLKTEDPEIDDPCFAVPRLLTQPNKHINIVPLLISRISKKSNPHNESNPKRE